MEVATFHAIDYLNFSSSKLEKADLFNNRQSELISNFNSALNATDSLTSLKVEAGHLTENPFTSTAGEVSTVLLSSPSATAAITYSELSIEQDLRQTDMNIFTKELDSKTAASLKRKRRCSQTMHDELLGDEGFFKKDVENDYSKVPVNKVETANQNFVELNSQKIPNSTFKCTEEDLVSCSVVKKLKQFSNGVDLILEESFPSNAKVSNTNVQNIIDSPTLNYDSSRQIPKENTISNGKLPQHGEVVFIKEGTPISTHSKKSFDFLASEHTFNELEDTSLCKKKIENPSMKKKRKPIAKKGPLPSTEILIPECQIKAITEGWTKSELQSGRVLAKFKFKTTVDTRRTVNIEISNFTAYYTSPEALLDDEMVFSVFKLTDDGYNDYFITSFEVINCYAKIMNVDFSSEGKKLLRGCCNYSIKQETLKTNTSSFDLLIGFENPRPRAVARDIKIFYWRDLNKIFTRMNTWYHRHNNHDLMVMNNEQSMPYVNLPPRDSYILNSSSTIPNSIPDTTKTSPLDLKKQKEKLLLPEEKVVERSLLLQNRINFTPGLKRNSYKNIPFLNSPKMELGKDSVKKEPVFNIILPQIYKLPPNEILKSNDNKKVENEGVYIVKESPKITDDKLWQGVPIDVVDEILSEEEYTDVDKPDTKAEIKNRIEKSINILNFSNKNTGQKLSTAISISEVELTDMTKNWTDLEIETSRRLVKVKVEPSNLIMKKKLSLEAFTAIYREEEAKFKNDKSLLFESEFKIAEEDCMILSCFKLDEEELKGYFVTSYEILALFQMILGVELTNNIKKSLRGIMQHPYVNQITLLKGTKSFDFLIGLQAPKPREKARHSKIFHWSDLSIILNKMNSWYWKTQKGIDLHTLELLSDHVEEMVHDSPTILPSLRSDSGAKILTESLNTSIPQNVNINIPHFPLIPPVSVTTQRHNLDASTIKETKIFCSLQLGCDAESDSNASDTSVRVIPQLPTYNPNLHSNILLSLKDKERKIEAEKVRLAKRQLRAGNNLKNTAENKLLQFNNSKSKSKSDKMNSIAGNLHHTPPKMCYISELKFNFEDLKSMLQNWTTQECLERRRIVKIQAFKPNEKVVNFKVFTSNLSNSLPKIEGTRVSILKIPNSPETANYFLSSYDILKLCVNLVKINLYENEKNKLKRIMDGFANVTLKKNTKLFEVVMRMTDPSPRYVRTELKLFLWMEIPKIMLAILEWYKEKNLVLVNKYHRKQKNAACDNETPSMIFDEDEVLSEIDMEDNEEDDKSYAPTEDGDEEDYDEKKTANNSVEDNYTEFNTLTSCS
ncbi:hypothetical protein HK099_004806 [Clydaea vesicula]|uniref:DUF7082 domain-containing protein n=1 Tax=Clydaea vesicula TaxID=447962 RepID=A0AAD5XVD0_9FUNG|nr:hypothetical protein HK099_004806 [Clydaea vesicula]